MATLLNRFRRKSPEDSTETPQTESQGPQNGETTETIDFEKQNSGNSGIEKQATQELNPEHPEKRDPETAGEPSAIDGEDEASLPEDVRELPKIVRNIVSLEDDPNAPTITFRYFLLCFIFIPPGAILFQMGSYRTTSAVYPVLFVQIGKAFVLFVKEGTNGISASHYVGYWLAEILPKKTVRIPFTKFSFSLNPGPWHVKGACALRPMQYA